MASIQFGRAAGDDRKNPVRAGLLVFVGAALTVACGFPKTVDGPPPAITPQQAERAAQEQPGLTQASLNGGRDLFAAKCNGCHGYPDIAAIPDERWPEILKRMSKKANLVDEQANQVLAFVRAAKTK